MQCSDLENTIHASIQSAFTNILQSHKLDHTLPTEFVKKGNKYELLHYVGSMKPENIHVTEHSGYVTIQGHHTATDPSGSYCSYSFTQHAPIPEGASTEKLNSILENGHVKLSLPL
jgi:HSP20 family molecular chaperone IbpA